MKHRDILLRQSFITWRKQKNYKKPTPSTEYESSKKLYLDLEHPPQPLFKQYVGTPVYPAAIYTTSVLRNIFKDNKEEIWHYVQEKMAKYVGDKKYYKEDLAFVFTLDILAEQMANYINKLDPREDKMKLHLFVKKAMFDVVGKDYKNIQFITPELYSRLYDHIIKQRYSN